MFRTLIGAVCLVGVVAVGLAPVATAQRPYKNCTEARANGDTNIPSSSPKYGPHLDRDRDGIGCES
ncbi:calcium-binding protein [Mycolicibacterium elephantis]|uniref:Calcium-binding protein n=1 Tax=Mycolicibacterium elephantis TaxID=81858 RepID=A0A1X0D796_9MYCO|nr:excalibur calcium-binding domain-containing protein [Mycolicibacterium elephantis]ORA68285.1 calcium-binding protein [Mycolicibacterium elephantis]